VIERVIASLPSGNGIAAIGAIGCRSRKARPPEAEQRHPAISKALRAAHGVFLHLGAAVGIVSECLGKIQYDPARACC